MEAIADFKKYLEDTKSPIIQQLVNDFGAEVVFSKERKFSIDDEMLRKIFDSLNKSFFNSKLPVVEMRCLSYEDIREELILRAKEDKTFKGDLKIENTFNGVYSVVLDRPLDQIKSEDDVVFCRDLLMMNTNKLSNEVFIYIVASVCHEMIHCYDRFFGDYRRMVADNIEDLDAMDSHDSYVFQRMMKKANKMRLNVIKTMNKPDKLLSANAYNVLIKGDPLYESKREELEKTGQVQLGDLILYDYGRKGMIIHFD